MTGHRKWHNMEEIRMKITEEKKEKFNRRVCLLAMILGCTILFLGILLRGIVT